MRPAYLHIPWGYKTRNPMFWWYWYNTLRKNCVLYLPMIYNNSAKTELKDWSGTGNNGIIHGATKITAPFNQAMSFDGTDDYVDCGNDTSLDITDAITIEAWVKPAVTNDIHLVMCGKSGSTFNLFRARSGLGDDALEVGWQINGDYLYGNTKLVQDTWWHVVATYDKDAGSKIYVNGVIDGQNTKTGAIASDPTNDVDIGRTSGWGSTFNGAIDEVRIYNRALSAEEILKIYNWTKSAFGK